MLDIILLLTVFCSSVYCEGYYCPYNDLGSTSGNELLYDYYFDNDGTYWTRKGETGWMTVTEYCRNKGDTSLHSDAGEWKCNDSHLLCIWDGNTCNVNQNRNPDCKELCSAIINNMGPQCLGNCAGGRSSNTLYSQFCEPSLKSNEDNNKDTKVNEDTKLNEDTKVNEDTKQQEDTKVKNKKNRNKNRCRRN